MNKSLQTAQPHSPGSSSYGVHDLSIAVPVKLVEIAEIIKKEKLWFVTSQIPTDLTVQVQDITFYVHKYPLVSRSGYISRLDLQPSSSNFESDLKLENFPGGSETFEIILKFCYGLPVDLTPTNVAPLRCASEFLDMTEEFEDGNLIVKTESFLTLIVLSSWRDSIAVLKSCESLSPWAENLQIVRRCSDSIARKASTDKTTTREMANDEGWWFESVSTLRIDHFVRIITAIRAKGLKPEIIGACIMHYAEKWLPPGMDVEFESRRQYGYEKNELQLTIFNGRREEGSAGHFKERKMIVESLVSLLPPQREAVSCKFLLGMLQMALVYSVTPALVLELEKRVGMVLDDANVKDLLIPNYRNGDEGKLGNPSGEFTMHDADMVLRIVEYFLMHEQQQQQQQQPQQCAKLDVGKLLDGYLSEIARDPNLSISKFLVIVEALPKNTRSCHDSLYKAIDTYLKMHPALTENDRRRLCKAIDCEKLSLDACMHAAQNDRLPLRTLMQVFFSEQIKMRTAMQVKEPMPNESFSKQEGRWSSTRKEVETIKAELENVQTKMAEQQLNYSELQREFEKLNKQKSVSGWSTKWKKVKNSAFMHGKIMDGEKDGEKRLRHSTVGCGVSFPGRLSIS